MALTEEQKDMYRIEINRYRTLLLAKLLNISPRVAQEMLDEDWKSIVQIMYAQQILLGRDTFLQQKEEILNQAGNDVVKNRIAKVKDRFKSQNQVAERLLKAGNELINSTLPLGEAQEEIYGGMEKHRAEFRKAFWVFEQQLMLGLISIKEEY